MYLFEENRGRITVYSFSPLKYKTMDFKKQEMKRIKGETVFEVIEKLKPGEKPIFSKDFSKTRHLYTQDELKNVAFIPYEEDAKEETLKEFYEGTLTEDNNPNLVMVKKSIADSDHNKYYLVGHSSYLNVPSPVCQTVRSYKIIRIPKTLYLLSALEQKKFDLTMGENINRQLKLFYISPVCTFGKNPVMQAAYYGLADETNMNKTLRNDGQFLRRVREQSLL